ncbi:hypothetical protein [Caulobacter sp.]|uniref:hypothetical protein n=1 Tax=Caulobacter sp. TaxID=78 RepID=UPI0025BBA357|nr:hypothetical protein [Caulobacter sp.]MBQ1561649.1 hypothetical protein [Caulobacter sp.]
MTRHFSPPVPEETAVPAMLVAAARCWRAARDSGEPIQPALTRTLDPHGCTMLAPVLDSLFLFVEAALGRPMTVGAAQRLSEDEHLLLGLMDESEPSPACPDAEGMSRVIACAIRSARIMIAMIVAPLPARPSATAPTPTVGADRLFAWSAMQHRDQRHDQRARV